MHPKLRDQSTHLLLKVWKYYFWALTIICCHQLFLSSLKLVLFHAQGSAQEEYTGFLFCWFKGEICGTGFNIAKSIKWALESNTAYSQIQPKGLSDVNDPNSSSFYRCRLRCSFVKDADLFSFKRGYTWPHLVLPKGLQTETWCWKGHLFSRLPAVRWVLSVSGGLWKTERFH